MPDMLDLPACLLSLDAVHEGPCVLEALVSFDGIKYRHLCEVSVLPQMPKVFVFTTQAVLESRLETLMMQDTSIFGYYIFIHQKLCTCAAKRMRR